MTNIQSSRAIAVALMVVLTLMALALPVAGQELTPVLTVTYTDGSTTVTPGSSTGGETWHFNVVYTGVVASGEVTMPDGSVIVWDGQNGANLADPCGPAGGQATWHWVLTASQNLTISDATCAPLSVVLNDFAAACQGDEIVVTWETANEIGNLGFNLIRGLEGMGTTVEIGFVPSLAPGSGQGASYTFIDSNIVVGVPYAYSIESVDVNGATVRYGPVFAGCEPPTALRLATFSADGGTNELPWLLFAICFFLGVLVGALVYMLLRRPRS